VICIGDTFIFILILIVILYLTGYQNRRTQYYSKH